MPPIVSTAKSHSVPAFASPARMATANASPAASEGRRPARYSRGLSGIAPQRAVERCAVNAQLGRDLGYRRARVDTLARVPDLIGLQHGLAPAAEPAIGSSGQAVARPLADKVPLKLRERGQQRSESRFLGLQGSGRVHQRMAHPASLMPGAGRALARPESHRRLRLASPEWADRRAEEQLRKLGAEPEPEQPAPDSQAGEPEPAG